MGLSTKKVRKSDIFDPPPPCPRHLHLTRPPLQISQDPSTDTCIKAMTHDGHTLMGGILKVVIASLQSCTMLARVSWPIVCN